MTHLPLPLTGATATLIPVAPEDVLPALAAADPSRRQWTIKAGQVVLHLSLRVPDDLVRAMTLLGPSRELAGHPLTLHLLLALLARGATVDAGTAAAAEVLARQLGQERSITEIEASPPETDAAIRAIVQEAIANADVLRFAGRWNLARALVELGCQLWQVRGQAARPFSLSDGLPASREALQPLAFTATLATPLVAATLPLALNAGAQVTMARTAFDVRLNAWYDWMSIALGPDPLPGDLFPDGLGIAELALPENREEELSLEPERAELLRSVARSLLRETQTRPAPRYLHQVLRVSIPRRVGALLSPWNVTGIRVIPHVEGMYIAIETSSVGGPAAVAWWSADDSYELRAPLSYPPALWLLIHTIAAAFWRDLHAAAVVVEVGPAPSPSQPNSEPRPQRGKRAVILPPVRRVRSAEAELEHLARWSSPEEEEAISYFTKRDGRYRALPRGWENREHLADFQRRRRDAAKRAQAEGYPEPQPGFTFVQAHELLTHRPPNKVVVVSYGLLRLSLGADVPLSGKGDH